MTELCERSGITRPTGYKWVARQRAGGSRALDDRRRTPRHSPSRTSDDLEALILEARQEYGWGAKKLLRILATRYPHRTWPARRTVNALLERRGLFAQESAPSALGASRRRGRAHGRAEPDLASRFQRSIQDRQCQYCYPLTVTDHFSRALLVCRGLPSVKTTLAQPVFRALFREVGLPDAIRTDNGAPFASTGIHGLSALNVWWMQLGIVHQRITPASPQENGPHERMHRELKRETARPAAHSARAAATRMNTGNAIGVDAEGIVARQTIHHDRSRASYLELLLAHVRFTTEHAELLEFAR